MFGGVVKNRYLCIQKGEIERKRRPFISLRLRRRKIQLIHPKDMEKIPLLALLLAICIYCIAVTALILFTNPHGADFLELLAAVSLLLFDAIAIKRLLKH